MNARDHIERRDSDPHAYSRQFDQVRDTAAFDRHFAPLLATFAPPQSEVHRITEAQRIAADLEYNRRKNSGELLRREIDRAHQQELNDGDHQ